MPTLPGKELSQEHFDRVVAAFPGTTIEEKAVAYDDWLTNRLIEKVYQTESQKIRSDMEAAAAVAIDNLTNSLIPMQRPEPAVSAGTLPLPDAVPLDSSPREGTPNG